MKNASAHLQNEMGLITVDFLFAIVLILGFSSLLFVVSFSLSVASITQYVTFATARNYMAGNLTPELQASQAQAKYKELTENPVLKPLYKNGWYQIDAEATLGDHTQVIEEYEEAAQGVNKFWGAGTNFGAPVLDFNVPFFGSTAPDSDGSGSGFVTYLGSYLGREPSTQECLNFTAARWDAIRKLSSSGGASYGAASASGYFPMTDNGC